MIEVTLDGYRYYYQKSKEGNSWLGVAGYNGSMGRYPHCRVPSCLWKDLLLKAIEDGHPRDEFRAPKKEEKAFSKRTYKKKDKNSISIF